MAIGIQKFINVKNGYFFRSSWENIPGTYCSLNIFFRSRLSHVRQRYLGLPSVVKPLEASGQAVLMEETLRNASPPNLVLCALCLLLSDSSNWTVPTEEIKVMLSLFVEKVVAN
jgi:hypothetical protein